MDPLNILHSLIRPILIFKELLRLQMDMLKVDNNIEQNIKPIVKQIGRVELAEQQSDNGLQLGPLRDHIVRVVLESAFK